MASCAKLIVSSTVLIALCAAPAEAQSAGYPNRQMQAQQQHTDTAHAPAAADAKRAAAEADRERAQAEAQRSATAGGVGFNGNYLSGFHISAAITDDFARTAVPVYLLPNGVRLRTSGQFRPNQDVRCVLYCETGLRH
jgi:hypothetical protein